MRKDTSDQQDAHNRLDPYQGQKLSILAPLDIRDFKPVPMDGETQATYAFRSSLLSSLLKQGGY